MNLVARLVAALGLVFAFACATPAPEPAWVSGIVEAQSERILWDVIALALEKSDFPTGAGMDPANHVALSGWHNSLAPFRGMGYRQRCEIRYEPKSERKFDVHVRVQREKNMDIIRPIDVTYAEWEPDAEQPDLARVVLQYIRSLLGPGTGAAAPAAKPPAP